MTALKPTLRATLVLAALTLSGCFLPTTEWVKEGANPDDLRYAQRACEQESSGYAFVDTSRYDDVGAPRGDLQRVNSASGDSYRRCMEGQGWRRERRGQTSAAK